MEGNYIKVGSNRTQTGHPQPTQPGPSRAFARRLAAARADITAAAAEFEGRWTLAALAAVEPELVRRLASQRRKWGAVLASDDEDQILEHCRAMARGYRVCADAMEAAGRPDDAYRVVTTVSGRVVTFGPKSCAVALAERFPGSSHYTFEEAAELLAGLSGVDAVKAAFPGAEIVSVRNRGE